MNLSPIGKAVLVARKGRRLTAYRDTAGIWTIGIGHTAAAGPPAVRRGLTITAAECDAIFARDVETYTAAVREGLASRFAGLPDVHYGNDRHWVSGDLGVSEWLLTGTTPDGDEVRVRGCDHWEFRDGLVVRKDSYWKIVDRG